MARRKRVKSAERKTKALGLLFFLLALLFLVALVTHQALDDARITGEVDRTANPFELQYRNQGGMVGAYLAYFSFTILGWLAFFIPLGFILLSLKLFSSELADRVKVNSLIIFVICLVSTMIYNVHIQTARQLDVEKGTAGGYVGEKLTYVAVKVVGETGSYILLGGIILVLLILYTSITPVLSMRIPLIGSGALRKALESFGSAARSFFRFEWFLGLFGSDDSDEESEDGMFVEADEERESEYGENASVAETTRPEARGQPRAGRSREVPRGSDASEAAKLHLKSIDYSYPTPGLLRERPEGETAVDRDELQRTGSMLKDTLETFGVHIDGSITHYPGPVITRFEFKPGSGIKVNQIVNLSDDLALALKAKRIRIIAPIPGKAAVGIEIPNRHAETVYLREILESELFQNPSLRLPLALGKTTSGRPYVTDLTKMPHLLIAGATGSGKSVCLNVMITSLLYRLHPHQLRLIFIDPKMLELSVYTGIPHMGRPVVTNPRRAEKVLADAVLEMESRYRKLAAMSVRSIVDYNAKKEKEEDKLPYIVICVDELADMMMSATSSRTEMLITRLAQMSRAVGIHLILATQRPSVDVITGLIKANFPARIAFQVSSKVDSRTIIDANGAEKLLGNGDMLFLHTGQPEPMRIHGAFISSEETEDVVKFIKDQGLQVMALEGITQATGEASETEVDFGDPLFKEACEVVVRHKQGSVSLLQRRLGIGYQRAARLIDKLEQAGIVSTFDGSKAREVLVDKAYLETLFSSPDETSQVNSGQN